MEHRAVSCAATAEVMPLHKSGKPTSFAGSHDMNKFIRVEDVDHHLVAWVCAVLALNTDFAHESGRCHIGFFKMTGHWFRDALGFHELDQSKLDGIVAILLLRLFLDDNAGPRLNHSDGNNGSIISKQLRHSDFLA